MVWLVEVQGMGCTDREAMLDALLLCVEQTAVKCLFGKSSGAASARFHIPVLAGEMADDALCIVVTW